MLLIKSITWRILAISSVYIISMCLGISNSNSIKLTILLNICNHLLYIGHDYIWMKIKDGKNKIL